MADADKELNLEALLKLKEQQEQARDELDQKIRRAQQASATKNYEKVVELLGQNGRFFSLVQRNTIMRLIEPEGGAVRRDRAPGRAPKYQLDSGITWTGHGKKTSGFDAWANSAEGKKWRAANPGQAFPSYPNSKAVSTPPSPRPTPTPTPRPTPTPTPTPAAKKGGAKKK